MSIFNQWKGFSKSIHKSSFILLLLVSFIFSSEKANAARIFFNDVYKGTGSSYAEQTNSISNIQFITGAGFTFTSLDPADVTFRLTGNNVAGVLTYVNSSGVKQSITGQVSRQDKNGSTTVGLYFYTNTNEAYLLVIPGVTSYSSNTNVSTSSDPILAVMNDVLTAQNSQPKITVNDVTVNNTDSYAVFTVSLSSVANANSTFTPSLTAVTATLNTDYTSSMQYYNGSAWVNISSSVSIAQGATSIQIRVPILNAGAASNRTFNLNTGAITGSNVLNSDGAYGIGTILPSPLITTSGTLKRFSNCSGCSVSPQIFTVSGSNLTAGIVVTAPTGVQVSTSQNTGYQSSVTISQVSNAVTTTTVYVKLTTNSTTVASDVLSVTSTGATSKTLTVTTNTDNAMHFDGTNDYVVLDNVGSNANLAFTGTTNFTLEAWINRETNANSADIISKNNGGVNSNYRLFINSDGKPVFAREASPWSIVGSNSIPINEWHHVAGVFDGTSMKIYVDGVLSNSVNTAESVASSVSAVKVYIGATDNTAGGTTSKVSFFKGKMDEVRIWNVARNLTQIQNSYLTELAGNETGLVAYYNFNQGVLNGTNSINDIITNRTNVANINGTLQGFAMSGTTSNFVPGLIPEISGQSILNKGLTTNYTNGLTGGSWSSAATNIATVDPSTGVVTGVNAGSSTITYIVCDKTVSKLVTVVIPTITTSGSLTAFNSCLGTASASQTFTVSAQYLTANLILTAPTGYEIATTAGGTYSSTISIAPSSGTVSARLIYVRLASTAIDGQSGNITITSTDAITQNLATGNASVTSSVGGSISGSVAVCSGTNSTILTLSGETGSITKWQSSLTSNFSSVTDIASTTASITATNLTATTYYRAVVTLGSCTAANSSVATFTVNPLPTVSVNVIPDVTTSATSFSLPYANLSAGADQYSLTAGTTAMANFVTVSNASITTSPLTISIPTSVQNSYDFNLTVKNSTTGCTSAVVPFVLSVTDITPGTLSPDQSICYGNTAATITSTADAGVGSPTYIWQISTNGHSGTYTDISGATSASYTHPFGLTATTHFRRKATIGSSFAITHPVEVLVNSLPVISVSPSSATITTGSSVSLTASGANTYSWTPSTGLSTTNTAVVTASPTATTTYTVTGTNSTTTCSSTATVTVTVNAALTAGSISANQTICIGATPASLSSATNASGGTGSLVYVWQSSIDGTTFNTISGATSSTYSPGAISVNTYFRRGVSTATDAAVYTSAILITVQESVGGSIAGSAAVCTGTNSTVLTLSGQTGSITKWQSALAANFSGAVTDIASTTASITVTNLTVTAYYRAVITLGSCSAVNSSVASVTVNALPVISVSPSAPSITSGSSVSLTASGANTYSWTPSSGLSATNTAVVTASPTVTTTYTVTGTRSSCSSTASVTITVTSAATADTDGDGVTDTQEIADGTDPNRSEERRVGKD